MANAAVAAPQPPPLHLYWYMLGSAAAPQEKKTGPLLLRGCTVFDIGQNYHHIIHDASIYSFETHQLIYCIWKNFAHGQANFVT